MSSAPTKKIKPEAMPGMLAELEPVAFFGASLGASVGALVGVAAGAGSLLVIPVVAGILSGLTLVGLPLFRYIRSKVEDELFNMPGAKLVFFEPENEENYDAFLERIYPTLSTGDLVVDTKSLDDKVNITFMTDKRCRIDWAIAKGDENYQAIKQAEPEVRTKKTTDIYGQNNFSELRKKLIKSSAASKMNVYYHDKGLWRALECGVPGTIALGVVGLLVCSLAGFPLTSPLGLGILAACIAVGSIGGASIGAKAFHIKGSGLFSSNSRDSKEQSYVSPKELSTGNIYG